MQKSTLQPGIVPHIGIVRPVEAAILPGRTILFEWDARDQPSETTSYELSIRRVEPSQSAAQAVTRNKPVLQVLVDHVQFYVLDALRLGKRGVFVWQVTAPGGATTAPRTFGTDFGPLVGLRAAQGADPASVADSVQSNPALRGQACPNGDLEFGNLQGWRGYYGTRASSATVDLGTVQSGFLGGRHQVQSLADGNDPYTGIPQVAEGNHSVRLGMSTGNSDAYLLAYTFTVTAQNKNFGFRFAAVLDHPSDHRLDEMPFFSYYIVRGASMAFTFANPPVAGRSWVPGRPDATFSTVGIKAYTPWTPICTDLSPYEGEVMTIVFCVTGCSQGGHGGYVYIDGVCGNNAANPVFSLPDRACQSSVIVADANATTGETSHYWSMEESDAQGNRNPATEVGHWWVGQQVGNINLNAYYFAKTGQALKCNTYYRVKLAVINECTPWKELVRLLYVSCPPVTGGPSLCVSCQPNGATSTLGIGNPVTSGTTYQWTPAAGLDNPLSPTPRHTHGSVAYPFTYTVTAKDRDGCTKAASVTLYCTKPTVTLSQKSDCCKTTIYATTTGAEKIQWSTGETDVTSIRVGQGNYTVTVSNPCGSATASIYVAAGGSSFVGPVHTVEVSTAFLKTALPNRPYTDKMVVVDVNVPLGTPNAYNATRYRLEIFGGITPDGNPMRTITGENCNGFENGSIFWDGKWDNGTYAMYDHYAWLLYFGNCQYEGLRPARVRRRTGKRACVDWATFLGVKLWCKAWRMVSTSTTEDDGGGGQVSFLEKEFGE